MSKQYSFYFDPDRCIKCWACEIACKQWKGIKAGTIRLRRVIEITTGSFPNVRRRFHSISCLHCAKAPCIDSCPAGAITKRVEDGIILVNREKCIGCRQCLEACPFGIPQFGEDGLMYLCDMCLDRLQENKKPICVDSCPVRALHWGTPSELADIAAIRYLQKKPVDTLS